MSCCVYIDGYQLDNFQRYASHHPYPSSSQIMSSTEEVLRSLAYQQHLVSVTRNYYSTHQHRYDNNASSQTSSLSSSPSLAAFSYMSPKHNFLSPGPAQSRPSHSLPVSRRTSFACSSSYPSFHHLGPSVSCSNVLVSNTSRGGSAKLDTSRKYSSSKCWPLQKNGNHHPTHNQFVYQYLQGTQSYSGWIRKMINIECASSNISGIPVPPQIHLKKF